MRTIVGVIGVLGLGVTVAAAQPPRERAAALRPPEPVRPGDVPASARGVADDFPPAPLESTPVTRGPSRAPAQGGPAWLYDSGVQPAAGLGNKAGVRTLATPAPASAFKDEQPVAPKTPDKQKSGPTAAAPARQASTQPPVPPTAETPYRGTGPSGAPVYAGPPAYRWYGWGTVTPGANQFAPNGQYPKASANWYAITGATPGAFPVPVMNPLRNPPGTEPPDYGTARASYAPPAQPLQAQQQQVQQYQPPRLQTSAPIANRPEPPRFGNTADAKVVPPPSLLPPPPAMTPPAPAAVTVPKLTPPPSMPALAEPVVSEPVSAKVPVPAPAPLLPPAVPKPEPLSAAPPVLTPLPVAVLVAEPAKPVVPPGPLPVSVTEEPKGEQPKPVEPVRAVKPEGPKADDTRWQTAPDPAAPPPGTWAPAATPLPVNSNNATPSWKSGAAPASPVVARAQMPDAEADPIAGLIKVMCRGRAEGVDVRYSSAKKLMVCFEVRTAPDAQKLVSEISKRPELAPYQIDFCVVVK
ncbi:MAG: hypothetical protein ACKODX_10365 [Gemmata sp.]